MKILIKHICFSLIFFVQGFCLEPVKDSSNLPILHPEISKSTSMQKLRLDNGIQVLLISDQKAPQSSAALSVKVGSFQDTKDAQGIAHFVEHMLFKSNAKYSEDQSFMKFVGEHNGEKNAYTANGHTVYMFEIATDTFKDGLDRFSQFFISPSFNQSELSREISSINEEWQRAKENDGWKFFLVQSQLANPLHPFHLFPVGNNDTLGSVTHEKMKSWFESYYAPSLMSLVLYSPLPMDMLKTHAEKFFEKVPKRNSPKIDGYGKIFSKQQENHVVTVESTNATPTLYITWEFSKKETSDLSHSLLLINDLLNSSYTTSLSKLLKSQNWVTSFEASFEKFNPENSLFILSASLTEKGLKEKDKVFEYILSYLHTLSNKKIPKFFYDEFKQNLKRNYQYGERIAPYALALQCAANLASEDIETFPRKTLLPKHFDEPMISSILHQMTPTHASFVLFLPKGKEKGYDQTEIWSKTPFKLEKAKMVAKSLELDPLPKINPYLKKEIELIDLEKSPKVPLTLAQTENAKIYYSSANETPSPQVIINLRYLLKKTDAKTKALLSLYINAFQEFFEEKISQAARAGGHFTLSQNNAKHALQLSATGYSYPTLKILKESMQEMPKCQVSKEKFEIYKNNALENFESFKKDIPINQSRAWLSALLNRTPTPDMLERATKKIIYDEFVEFSKNIFLQFKDVESLVSGNISKETADNLAKEIATYIPSGKKAHKKSPKNYAFAFTKPQKFTRPTTATGTGFFLAIDEGNFSLEKLAFQTILDAVMSEDFFDSIRSKQKIAYQAHTYPLRVENELFHVFMILSSAYHTPTLLARTEQFIEHFFTNLSQTISKERFESIRTNLVQYNEKPYANLSDYTNDLFTGIFDLFEKEEFAFRAKYLEALKKISYEEFVSHVKSWLSSANKKRLLVSVEGKIENPKDNLYEAIPLNPLKKKLSKAP